MTLPTARSHTNFPSHLPGFSKWWSWCSPSCPIPDAEPMCWCQGCRRPAFFCHQLYLFKLCSQVTQELPCFQCALSFYGEVLAFRRGDTVWHGHGAHFPPNHSLPSAFMCSTRPLLSAKHQLPSRCCMRPMVGAGSVQMTCSELGGAVPGAWRGLHSVLNQREV